ncbi:MAG TPA: type II toxin-antitoxin system HigB family toxin [Tepidisphaeraceae bacterium]|nr:type II toxin-antitoxin system HigB family toxin [Tepidisphaeraceae bacterium]
MRVIARRPLVEFWKKHAAAENPLVEWYQRTRKATWSNFTDVKATFGQTDSAKVDSGRQVCIFDIGGNKFRLVAAVHYNTQTVFILRVLTHKEYDWEKWKREL